MIDLLIKMGYGGSRRDAGEAIGKSGDGGIDGARLAELMIEHNIGTSTQNIYEVKKVDSDYFTED